MKLRDLVDVAFGIALVLAACALGLILGTTLLLLIVGSLG